MQKPHILVVEDDPKTAHLVRVYLESDVYRVTVATDGEMALRLADMHQPDLIVLDLMLPKMDGREVCQRLRDADNDVPIIMLTARSTEADILHGLGNGADDYITKPFSPKEVVARVKAVLKRAHKPSDTQLLEFDQLRIDLVRHEVCVDDVPLRLTPKEFDLLVLMAKSPGRAFSRAELVEKAFGHDYDGMERTVDAHVMNLRKKIEPDPADPIYVETVYGIGYRFMER